MTMTNTPSPEGLVEVTQVDIAAAREIVAQSRIGYGEAIRRGEAFRERVEAVAEGYAHGRLASTPPAVPANVGAGERARALLTDLDRLLGKPINTGLMAEAAFKMILTALSTPATPDNAGDGGELVRIAQMSSDIEALLGMAKSDHSGDDEYEDIVERWRAARGDAAYDAWRWWWREGEDESYRDDHATREEALAAAILEADADDAIHLIEARCWADDLNDGDDIMPFADTRNHEIARAALTQEKA